MILELIIIICYKENIQYINNTMQVSQKSNKVYIFNFISLNRCINLENLQDTVSLSIFHMILYIQATSKYEEERKKKLLISSKGVFFK